jgi:TP901 family phage tail tape measure protein
LTDASEIGIRVSLVGGKVAAVEADTVAKSVRGIGTATTEADVAARRATGSTGGFNLLNRVFGGVAATGARAGATIASVGVSAERSGLAGGAAVAAFGEKLRETDADTKNWYGSLVNVGKYVTLGLAAGTAAVGYEAVKMSVEYQGATAAIAANANISIDAAGKITQSFLNTTGIASFSAQELAEAYSKVGGQLGDVSGKALNNTQAMSFMSEAWRLAEATGNDLNASTGDLSSTMQTFHLDLSQASTASNLLYNTSRLTGSSIDSLTTTEARLHTRLLTTMPSLQQMSGLMLDLAEHGARGSRGTMIAYSALDTLLGGTKQVNDMLKVMNVNLYDSQGNFVGLTNVFDQLRPKLAVLPENLRNTAEQTLFGSQSWQIMNGIVMDTNQTLDGAIGKVKDSGNVHEAAEKKLKAHAGQWEVLKSSAKNFMTELGNDVMPGLERLGGILLNTGSWLMQNHDALIAIAVVLGGVVAAAITAFVYEKGKAMIGSLSEMASGLYTLISRLWTTQAAGDAAAGGVAAESGAAAESIGTNTTLAGVKVTAAEALDAEAAAAAAAAGALGTEATAAQLSLFGPEAAGANAASQGVLFGEGASSTIAVSGGAKLATASTASKVAGAVSKTISGAGLIITAGQLLGGDNNPDIAVFKQAQQDLPGLEKRAGGAAALVRDIFTAAKNRKPGDASEAGQLLRLIGPGTVVPVARSMKVPGFQFGGTVPGAPGVPTLVVAHGGEEISPSDDSSPLAPTEPTVLQVILDRQVLGEIMIGYVRDKVARG